MGRIRDVLTKSLSVLLAVLSLAYAVMAIWSLVSGQTDPASVLWVFLMVPAVVASGAFLMWKRPRNQVGHLLVGTAILMFLLPTLLEVPTVIAYDDGGVAPWMWAPMWMAMTLTASAVVVASTLIVVLPDGHFRYPRERRFLLSSWIVVIFPTLSLVSNELVVTHSMSFPGVEGVTSPLVIGGLVPWGGLLATMSVAGQSVVFIGALTLQVMRYRSAPTRERKQVRWVIYAAVLAITIGLIPYTLEAIGLIEPLEHDLLAALFSIVPVLLFPAAVVVAVMEPPWIDVDIVIRKSFVYGALSSLILLMYIGVAASLGVAAGARLDVEVAVVLTVIIALLFQPARTRLQAVADRWVFGARPTKYEAVTELGETIEQASDPTELLPQLVDTIQRALALTWVAASLDDGSRAAKGSVVGEPVLTLSIGVGGDFIGEIECGPKTKGSIADDEVQLVQTLAGQVGLAVMNARLAGRIVNAAEMERRRIERNIHDGAQQELVALVARLGMARAAASKGGVSSQEISELQREAQRILSDLRELAQGIHPSVLSDGGILEAVEERCAHLPIDVNVEAPLLLRSRRYQDDIEGAAYFFVTESLANVLKHAGATATTVRLEQSNGQLLLSVSDNGSGFDPTSIAETGLSGLRDRFRALGGSVVVASRPGSGTTISASLPVVQ